jgi:hypothetical protein
MQIAEFLAPVMWLLWTPIASFWLARDIVREAHPGQSDVLAMVFMTFGIFCLQVLIGSVSFAVASAIP